MAVQLFGSDPTFGRDSPVRDYWLAHCAGFRVTNGHRRIGVVEAAYGDGIARVDELAVRYRWGRRPRRVSAEQVATIVPAQRLVILVDQAGADAPEERTAKRLGTAAAARSLGSEALAAARAGRRLALAAFALVAARTAAAARWLAPRSLQLDRALLRLARRGAAAAAAEAARLRAAGTPLAREALARGGAGARAGADRAAHVSRAQAARARAALERGAVAARTQATSSRAVLAARRSGPAPPRQGDRRPVRRARAASRRPPEPPPR